MKTFRLHTIVFIAWLFTAGLGFPCPAFADPPIPLPDRVPARVLRIIDGDTFEAEAYVWPDIILRIKVRLDGIDAPEFKASSKTSAQASKDFLSGLIPPPSIIHLKSPHHGKYAGRVVAGVETFDELDVASEMVRAGKAVWRVY